MKEVLTESNVKKYYKSKDIKGNVGDFKTEDVYVLLKYGDFGELSDELIELVHETLKRFKGLQEKDTPLQDNNMTVVLGHRYKGTTQQEVYQATITPEVPINTLDRILYMNFYIEYMQRKVLRAIELFIYKEGKGYDFYRDQDTFSKPTLKDFFRENTRNNYETLYFYLGKKYTDDLLNYMSLKYKTIKPYTDYRNIPEDKAYNKSEANMREESFRKIRNRTRLNKADWKYNS